jgi:hypothetical protein
MSILLGGTRMKINLKMIELLRELLSGGEFDDELFNRFLKLKQVEDLIIHDKELKRTTSAEGLKKSIVNTLQGCNNDKDCYLLNQIKKNIDKLDTAIKYININEKQFEENIYKRIERYVPLECLQECTYYIYAGGWDYGFCQNPNEVYINIGNMMDSLDQIEDILIHEFYHARKRNIDMDEFFNMNFSEENYLKILFNYFLEEGIATLIQLEYEQKTQESGILKKEDFDKKYEYMANLNKCITEISLQNNYNEKFIYNFMGELIPFYIIGYWIGQVLYKHGGKEYLNIWTIDHDYKKCMKIFIESLRKDNVTSGLSADVEEYILNYCLEE